jgi:hypothetical protein
MRNGDGLLDRVDDVVARRTGLVRRADAVLSLPGAIRKKILNAFRRLRRALPPRAASTAAFAT